MQIAPGDGGVSLNESSSFSQVQFPGREDAPVSLQRLMLAAGVMSVLDLKKDLGGVATASTILNDTCWVLGLCERLGS